MASLFQKRSTILGLPIGRKKTSWGKVAGWLVGVAALLAAVVIGRDTIQHSGSGSQSGSGGKSGGSGGGGSSQ
jgi:uncharacterized membrane protein YgcG